MKNKKGVVLSLLMSLLVSGSSAMENSDKGNNSKGGGTVTLEKRNNIEKGKTIAGYAIPTILAFILGYKFGHREVDYKAKEIKAKEIQEGKELNKCHCHNCERKGKEFGLNDDVYICNKCFCIICLGCLNNHSSRCSGSVVAMKIDKFIVDPIYLPAYKDVAKLAKYRFLMKAQEEQKKQNEELDKQTNKIKELNDI